MLFQKLLFFTQGYSGAANANIDADDHENGGVNAKFAEKGRDVQFGDIYDRKLLERHNFNAFLLLWKMFGNVFVQPVHSFFQLK